MGFLDDTGLARLWARIKAYVASYAVKSGNGVKAARQLTQAEYDALPYAQKMDGTTYYISDADATLPAATQTAAGLLSASDKKKLDGIGAGAKANVQPDWNVADASSDAYIRNKPLIPHQVMFARGTGVARYVSFCRLYKPGIVGSSPCGISFLVSGMGDFGHNIFGTYLFTVSTREVFNCSIVELNPSLYYGTNEVFGFWDASDDYVYVGAYLPAYTYQLFIHEIAKTTYSNAIEIGNLYDSATKPTGWTTLKVSKPATGVKGNSESTYRTGNVNLTAGNVGALPITGGAMSGRIQIPSRGSTWLGGMEISNAIIGISTTPAAGNYYPILAGKTVPGNIFNLGMINNAFGVYGFLKGRTQNGVDWYTEWHDEYGTVAIKTASVNTDANSLVPLDLKTSIPWSTIIKFSNSSGEQGAVGFNYLKKFVRYDVPLENNVATYEILDQKNFKEYVTPDAIGAFQKHQNNGYITNDYKSQFRTQTKGDSENGTFLSVVRSSKAGVDAFPIYSAAIALGVGDANAFLCVQYNAKHAFVGGGAGDAINWQGELAFLDSNVESANKAKKVLDSGRSNHEISLSYYKEGITETNWLAAWSGYELRAISVDSVKNLLGVPENVIKYKELTQAQYNALSNAEKMNNTVYFIKDG